MAQNTSLARIAFVVAMAGVLSGIAIALVAGGTEGTIPGALRTNAVPPRAAAKETAAAGSIMSG